MAIKTYIFQTYYLPGSKARSAQEVPTWFYPDILIVFRANLAQLKSTSHFTIEFILFLCDRYVVLRCRLYCPRQIWIYRPTIRIQITETQNQTVGYTPQTSNLAHTIPLCNHPGAPVSDFYSEVSFVVFHRRL